MKKIAFIVYRQWAFEIFEAIAAHAAKYRDFEVPLLVTTSQHEFSLPKPSANRSIIVLENGTDQKALLSVLREHNIDIACFYGWSWIVQEQILNNYTCLCLHPSPLPKYRGGSPLQYQIIADEHVSAVSIFKMGKGIDDGDVYEQLPFSLVGTLEEIFTRITNLGITITRNFTEDMINDVVNFTPQQDLDDNPPLKRRVRTDGEIELTKRYLFHDLHNIVRSLANPYPNAYINLDEGVLYVTAVCFRTGQPPGSVVVTTDISVEMLSGSKTLLLAVVDGFAILRAYRFEPSENITFQKES